MADAKRISDLQEAVDINTKDYLVINEYDSTTGYTLTKKIKFEILHNYIYDYVKKHLDKDYKLGELSSASIDELLNKIMCKSHTDDGLGQHSLALSAIEDLQLGDLAKSNISDLRLERFCEKEYATSQHTAPVGTYINGINQIDGKIMNISIGRFQDAVPIDAVIDQSSSNPVKNSAIFYALSEKMDKSAGNMKHTASEGKYIAGFDQVNGKITNVVAYNIPRQQIDDKLSLNSKNPVQNNVITAKIDELYAQLQAEMSKTYLTIANANSYATAQNGEYIKSIKQTNGIITKIETGKFSDITNSIESQINALRKHIDDSIKQLRDYVDATFVKLNTNVKQTITGPVKFNTKIDGNIYNADMSLKSKWQ